MSTKKSEKPKKYDRKEASISVCTKNFIDRFDKTNVEFTLDKICQSKFQFSYHLEDEQRRMYDILNVLEVVGYITRKKKGQFIWNGSTNLPESLLQLSVSFQILNQEISQFRRSFVFKNHHHFTKIF